MIDSFSSADAERYLRHFEASGVDRRSLLRIMGASLALAGLTGCRVDADETALAYVNAPDDVTIGNPTWYATAVTMSGYAQPVLGKTMAGRPVKLEGNPDHPVSQGASDAFTQAALLGLYDPGRSQTPVRRGVISGWSAFQGEAADLMSKLDGQAGKGFRLLTGPTSSPTFKRQIDALLSRWPLAKWHICDPIQDSDGEHALAAYAGAPAALHCGFDNADVIVSVGEDFLGAGPLQTRNAVLFGAARRRRQQGRGQAQLFVAEATPSATGLMADRRLIATPLLCEQVLRAILAGLDLDTQVPGLEPAHAAFVAAALAALRTAGKSAAVLVGRQMSPAARTIGLLINQRIGSLGGVLTVTDPILQQGEPLSELVNDMQAGQVSAVMIMDADPVFTAPADLRFAEALGKVAFSVHAGLYRCATAAACHWHLPTQHDLESWSDARAADGSVCLIQPLVKPFFDVRSRHSLLERIMGRTVSDRETVEATWRAAWGAEFQDRWLDSLGRGSVTGTQFLAKDLAARPVPPMPPAASQANENLALLFRPDDGVWDGSLFNNAWMQEMPRPFSTVTWDNVVSISPRLARQHHLDDGDEVRLTLGGSSVLGAARIVPGQAPGVVVVTLGYGQSDAEPGGSYNAYALRRSDALWSAPGVRVEATGGRRNIAVAQTSQAVDGFDFVRTLAPGVSLPAERSPSLYPDPPGNDPSWGMTIDLDLCIGCNACAVACQAENNVPVVGRELVAQGRRMHWLRIDRYHQGSLDDPEFYAQPVPCMHCEQAPCEMGCPVNATVHSDEGLNLQVYNRCIGTRTCSSYCPYKVRRFNWFDYTAGDAESIRAMRNPDVTVRSRGVMEKCTYCVQRIAQARIGADKEGRPIRDGEIVPACQQACPTQAITFGNVSDPASAVSRRKANGRNYALLEEAGTRPRTTYLARLRGRPAKG